MKDWRAALLVILAALAAIWCVAMPFYWARGLSMSFGVPYLTALHFFLPQVILAAIVTGCLLLVGFRQRVAVPALVVAAALAPILTLSIGNPTSGVWPVSAALLLLLAWRCRAHFAAQA
ncbi:hypothetical protein ELE36_15665 [Pseudolysobacter antarcticus]|uniref:DoxX family protein n=1 Tax=Pseudolysobacter antarcticus TaxID=2511995 RepID=A0A411HMI7_9GAMM|nr:hypothetical protein [Pseudolysobacter antarcticus]QBB71677.1 hypothetical protein ELE36_15665 [Pseudolysobacter antarcticus]